MIIRILIYMDTIGEILALKTALAVWRSNLTHKGTISKTGEDYSAAVTRHAWVVLGLREYFQR